MGRPPAHMILRRIVKNQFQRLLPVGLNETATTFNRLNTCWRIHGQSSDICKDFEAEYERALEADERFKQYMRN